MAINVSVHYNGGLLPDPILLTHGYCHRGTRFKCYEDFFFVFEAYETTILNT